MLEFVFFKFIPPFLLTFILPGILSFFIFVKKKVDLLSFFIYIIIFGFAMQIVIGVLIIILRLRFRWEVVILSLVLIAIQLFISKVYKRDKIFRTMFVAEGNYLIVACLVIFSYLLLMSHVQSMQHYFNPATDQYYWFTYSARLLHDPSGIIQGFYNKTIVQIITGIQAFPFLMVPYVVFLEKNIIDYQWFILVETLFFYLVWSLAIMRVAMEIIPYRSLAAVTPFIFFLPYWNNYYLLSAGVVPQNVGIFLFIAGFYIFYAKHWNSILSYRLFIIFYICLLFVVHVGTGLVFVLCVGITEMVTFVSRWIHGKRSEVTNNILQSEMRGSYQFILAATLPILMIVMIRYLLFYFRVFTMADPSSTTYYKESMLVMSLFNQPGLYQFLAFNIKLAILSCIVTLFIYLFSNQSKTVGIAVISFALSIFFIYTPHLTYNALLASWQPFRFFLFLYPGMAFLNVYLFSLFLNLLPRIIPWRMSNVVVGVGILCLFFISFINVHRQQHNVWLDMITGHNSDGVKDFERMKNNINELDSIEYDKEFNGERAVLYIPGRLQQNHIDWVVAPRPLFVVQQDCNQRSCYALDVIGFNKVSLEDALNKFPYIIVDKSSDYSKFVIGRLGIKQWNRRQLTDVIIFSRI